MPTFFFGRVSEPRPCFHHSIYVLRLFSILFLGSEDVQLTEAFSSKFAPLVKEETECVSEKQT